MHCCSERDHWRVLPQHLQSHCTYQLVTPLALASTCDKIRNVCRKETQGRSMRSHSACFCGVQPRPCGSGKSRESDMCKRILLKRVIYLILQLYTPFAFATIWHFEKITLTPRLILRNSFRWYNSYIHLISNTHANKLLNPRHQIIAERLRERSR